MEVLVLWTQISSIAEKKPKIWLSCKLCSVAGKGQKGQKGQEEL